MQYNISIFLYFVVLYSHNDTQTLLFCWYIMLPWHERFFHPISSLVIFFIYIAIRAPENHFVIRYFGSNRSLLLLRFVVTNLMSRCFFNFSLSFPKLNSSFTWKSFFENHFMLLFLILFSCQCKVLTMLLIKFNYSVHFS